MEGRFRTAEAEKAVMANGLQALRAENDAAPRQALEPRQPAPANQLVDTRLIGKPQSYDGDPTKFPDWSFAMKSYMSALNPAYQALLNVEASQVPMRNASLDPENAALGTQLYYVLVMLCTGSALNKCYNAGPGEGYETWRLFVAQWAPKLASRFVGLLTQLMSFHFDGDLVYKIGLFERLCCDYESQSGKRVEDDTKVGVMLLGMQDVNVREHLVRNSNRLATWATMSAEVMEISRTQAYIDSTPMPMQIGALPPAKKGKGRGKGKGKGRGKGKGKGKGKDGGKTVPTCYYCQKPGHKADLKAAERLAERDSTGDRRHLAATAEVRVVPEAPAAGPGFLLSLPLAPQQRSGARQVRAAGSSAQTAEDAPLPGEPLMTKVGVKSH